MPYGCLALLLLAWLLVLLPVVLADLVLRALQELGLSPAVSVLALLGIVLGGMVNIPVKRWPREEILEVPRVALFGLWRLEPQLVRRRREAVLAVNVGGCLVPSAIVCYELGRMAALGAWPLTATLLGVGITTAACKWIARPVPQVGVVMPALVPALVAALCGLLLLPEHAPVVAFVAGVAGTLIGADLLNLHHIKRIAMGTASIGGAGSFDGIVISGLVATLLAW